MRLPAQVRSTLPGTETSIRLGKLLVHSFQGSTSQLDGSMIEWSSWQLLGSTFLIPTDSHRPRLSVARKCRWHRFGPTVGERGYGSVLALALLFGGVLLIGLAADVSRLLVTWRETSHLAHTAAETGAGWVEPGALYQGELVVDIAAAETAAMAIAAGPQRSVGVDANSEEVCVTVEQTVSPGITRLVGGVSKAVVVTACAAPRQG